MDSQRSPLHEEESEFSMSRPEDLLFPPPPRPGNSPSNLSGIFPSCKVSEAEEADLLDISDSVPARSSVDITDREFPPDVQDGNGQEGDGNTDGDGVPSQDGRRHGQTGREEKDLLSQAIDNASSFSQDPVNHQDAGWNIMDSDSPPSSASVSVKNPRSPSISGNACRVLVPMGMEDEFHREDDVVDGAAGVSFPPPNQLAASSSSLAQPHVSLVDSKLDFNLRGATFIVDTSNPLSIRITSAIERANGFSPTVLTCKNEEDGFQQHDFSGTVANMPSMQLISDPTPSEMGEARFCSVRESTRSGAPLRTVRREPIIPFILFIRDRDGNQYIPSLTFFDLAVNKMEIHVMTADPDLLTFSWSATHWKGCGVLELSLEPELEAWRTTLSGLDLNGFTADTFPQDSLLMGPDVSALLKDPYWSYDITWFERSLIYRNRTLKGYVRTVLSKTYDSHDFTRHGVNMNNWKLVYLSGDCVFMEFLSQFPVNYRFKAGPSTTPLRGGIRKPTFLVEPTRTQYTWTRSPIVTNFHLPSTPVKELDPSIMGRLTLHSPSSSSSDVPAGAAAEPSAGYRVPLTKSASLPVVPSKSSSSSASSSSFPAKKTTVFKNKSKPKYRSERIKAARAKRECC